MRTYLAIMLSCVAIAPGCIAQTAQNPAPEQRTAPRSIKSPEVLPDGRVVFNLRAPQANAVSVAGEFMKGSKPMVKDASGVWSFTTEPLAPEIYGYNFTIDGVRTIDPGNPELKTGTIASTTQSQLHVTGDGPAFYDVRNVPHGEIRMEWYQSKSLGDTRRMVVYTPPRFDPSGRTKYPVLYLLHGANADETAWLKQGRVNLILDNLLADKKIKPFLVVMPFGYGLPPGSELVSGNFEGVLNAFSKDLLGDVIPFVEAHFPISKDRDHRAIAGLSMGGDESLVIGLNHLETFGYVAGFSPAIRPADFSRDFGPLPVNLQSTNHQLHLLWLGVGKDDSLLGAADSFSKFLDDAKIKHSYENISGAHTWIVWRQFLRDFSPQLF
jgi:enterochelin esterase-like enzyme